MRLGGTVSSIAFAVVVGCSAFSAEPNDPDPVLDGGTSGNTSSSGNTSGSSGEPIDSGSDVTIDSSCRPGPTDAFNRSSSNIQDSSAPWAEIIHDRDAADAKISDGLLQLDSGINASGSRTLLRSHDITPRKSVSCSFSMSKNSDFTAEDSFSQSKPVDVFVLLLRYDNGHRTYLRASLMNGKLGIRDQHYLVPEGTDGDPCPATTCPSAQVLADFAIEQDQKAAFNIEVTANEVVFRASAPGVGPALARRAITFGTPTSATIYLGIWNYSEFNQGANFDDLECNLDCAP